MELLLGGRNQQRFLKRSADHGRLDLLSLTWIPSKSGADGRLAQIEQPHWDAKTFAAQCAGCHATGVDSTKQTFAAISLDCFVCHGEVPDKHTTRPRSSSSRPTAATPQRLSPRSAAQCHLRTGKSKTSGLPYPNNFVAGDNLFRDFQVDIAPAAIENLNPADRHIQENIRDVVLLNREDVTCLSCHNIHQQSSKKHNHLADSAICKHCHASDAKKTTPPLPGPQHHLRLLKIFPKIAPNPKNYRPLFAPFCNRHIVSSLETAISQSRTTSSALN